MAIDLEFLLPSLTIALVVIIAIIVSRRTKCNLPPLVKSSLFQIVSDLESGRILDVYLKSSRELCKVFRIRAPQLQHFIIVTDSTLSRLILNGDKTHGYRGADKDIIYHRFEAGMLGVPNMFTKKSQGEGWEWVRKTIAPVFSNLNINKKLPILEKTLSKLCDMLTEYEGTAHQFDIQSLIFRFTFDFSTVALFGMCFDALGDSETEGNKFLHEVSTNAKEYFHKQFCNPLRKYFFWNKEVQRGLKAREYVELFQKNILDTHRTSMSTEELKTDPSLLGQLIRRCV